MKGQPKISEYPWDNFSEESGSKWGGSLHFWMEKPIAVFLNNSKLVQVEIKWCAFMVIYMAELYKPNVWITQDEQLILYSCIC